jgi:hypothetical protein
VRKIAVAHGGSLVLDKSTLPGNGCFSLSVPAESPKVAFLTLSIAEPEQHGVIFVLAWLLGSIQGKYVIADKL